MLTLTDVSLQRGGRRLLEGVSFSVKAGEIAVLTGPNGSGKTSLLRAASGLLDAVGKIDKPDSLVFMGHHDALKSSLTVRENLKFWADIYAQPDIAAAVLAYDLEQILDRPVARLSAGQKRRTGLARGIVSGQRLWVMDEPTVSLDQGMCRLFFDVVRRHLSSGGAVLAASHLPFDLPTRDIDISRFKPTTVFPTFDEAFL